MKATTPTTIAAKLKSRPMPKTSTRVKTWLSKSGKNWNKR